MSILSYFRDKFFAHSGPRSSWGASWWEPFIGRPTASQVSVSEESAMTYSAVWAATRLLAGTGSWLPLRLWRESDSEDGTTRTHLRTHPVQRLLKRPNPEMNGLQWRSIMWQWQVNWGNAYSEIVWSRNTPLALWPLKPWLVEPKRDDDTHELYYQCSDEVTSETRRIEASSMLHIPSILTGDGICGLGVIRHARESIGFGQATERHGAAWFGGGAVPRMVITGMGAKFDDKQRTAFRKEMNEIYGGPTGEKIATFGGDAKVQPISISQEDSQFLGTRQHNIEEIARWYGVPPHMLQHLLRATFNNIEHLGIEFVVYSLMLWMRAWEEAIEFKLLPMDDERDNLQVEHDATELLRGDSKAVAEFVRAMVSIGVMNRNEARRMVRLDPVPGGGVFLVQGANVPLDEEGKPSSEFANPGTPMPDEPEDDDTPTPPNSSSLKLAKAGMVQALNRVLAKESDRARAAAKKPDEFMDWLDSFYPNHEAYVETSLANISEICTSLGMECSAESLAETWCQSGRDDLLNISGEVTPSRLSDAVATHVQSKAWQQRPAAAVMNLEA